MNQRREKEGVVDVLCQLDMHIYTTHRLKLGMGQRREKEGVVLLTFDMHIYTTHSLKLRNESELCKRWSGYVKRLTCTSKQLTT